MAEFYTSRVSLNIKTIQATVHKMPNYYFLSISSRVDDGTNINRLVTNEVHIDAETLSQLRENVLCAISEAIREQAKIEQSGKDAE